jgi:hypothetical protein
VDPPTPTIPLNDEQVVEKYFPKIICVACSLAFWGYSVSMKEKNHPSTLLAPVATAFPLMARAKRSGQTQEKRTKHMKSKTTNGSNGINRAMWDILKRLARKNIIKGGRIINKRHDDRRGDMSAVARLVHVDANTAWRWFHRCDTNNPVSSGCGMARALRLLSTPCQPVAPVAPIVLKQSVSPQAPKAKRGPAKRTAKRPVKFYNTLPQEPVSVFSIDVQSLSKLSPANLRDTIKQLKLILKQKNKQKINALRQIRQLISATGLTANEVGKELLTNL